MNATTRTAWIRDLARLNGFAATGIVRVEPMDPAPLRVWLDAGFGAEMSYLARHLPLRANLREILPEARSVVCVALPYAGPEQGESPVGAVACYARGADYHDVVRARLERVWREVTHAFSDAVGRIFVDSGPLPERELARRAGLGWVGSHGCLIHSELGSRFVLGEILTTLELTPTIPISGQCGDCRRCLEACPTGALVSPGVVDARRCLSYLTIEHRGPIPRELRSAMSARLFGCDACQEACPHNRNVAAYADALVPECPLPGLAELLTWPSDAFPPLLAGRAWQRTGRRGLLRNACVALGNLGETDHREALAHALHDLEPLVRGHAAWGLGQLQMRDLLAQALLDEEDPYVREEIAAAVAD